MVVAQEVGEAMGMDGVPGPFVEVELRRAEFAVAGASLIHYWQAQ